MVTQTKLKQQMKITALSLFLLFLAFSANAQIEGLWKYDKVLVGEEVMTPVSKWSVFNADGTYISGNGWTQNESSFWDYNDQKKILRW